MLTIISWLIARELAVGEDYQMTEVPENCINNPAIRVSKTVNHYRLKLCSNNHCIPTDFRNWIRCRDVCEVCQSLSGQSGKSKRVHKFSLWLMHFSRLQKWWPVWSTSGCLPQQLYCANETTISTGTTAPTVTVTQVRQITTTTTVYTTTSVTSISYSIATDNVPTMYTHTILSNNTNKAV